MQRLTAGSCLLLVACFSPNLAYEDGSIHCDDGECPPGYGCRNDGFCWSQAGGPNIDAPVSIADARRFDAAPPGDGGGDGDASTTCTDLELRCQSNQPQICAGGNWVSLTPCPVDEPLCTAGVCGLGCTPQAKRCQDGVVEICDQSGIWQTQTTCTLGCDGDDCATGECTGDDVRCVENTPQMCVGGTWVAGAPCVESACVAGECTGSCVPDSKRCSNLIPQTCNSDGDWMSSPACAFACSAGDCVECIAPAARCSGNDRQTCQPDGRWMTQETCVPSCANGMCTTAACSEGDRDCAGKVPRRCNSGAWVNETACNISCVGEGECGECVPDDTKCESNTPYSCGGNGRWVAGPACTFVCEGKVCGGECLPTTKRCSAAGNVETCNSAGHWELSQTCDFGCASNACKPCVPDTMTRCQGKCGVVTNNCGNQVDCSTVSGGISCTLPQTCNGAGVPNACGCTSAPASTTCNGKCGTVIDNCGRSVSCSASNGGVTCTDPQLCGAGSAPANTCCAPESMATSCNGKCGTVTNNCGQTVQCSTDCSAAGPQYICGGAMANKCGCVPTTKRCENLVPQTCTASGTWSNGTACTNVCSGGNCVACNVGDKQCVDSSHYQSCVTGGTWGGSVSCPPSTECWGPGNCTVCTPTERDCTSSTQPRLCDGTGAWQNQTACSSQTCVNGVCQGVCTTGAKKCVSSTNYVTCDSAGAWGTVQSACSNQACVTSACVGVCTPGARRCSGSQPQLCNSSGQWGNDGSSCSAGCNPGTGQCCSNPCNGNAGSPCDTTVTSACGVAVTCSSACDGDFYCRIDTNTCGCIPGTGICPSSTQAKNCNASGTGYTTSTCTSPARCCLCDDERARCLSNCGSPICFPL